jgi:Ca2+-binding RTX toxin-like protein
VSEEARMTMNKLTRLIAMTALLLIVTSSAAWAIQYCKSSGSCRGDDKANFIIGTNGHNRIYGMGGGDEVDAKYGNDQIFGGDGHDEIMYGNGGNDFLKG